MTQEWRSLRPESPTSAFLRGRWPAGSLYVLDIDNLICHPSGDRGLLIEWKREDEGNRDWRITRILAQRAGWWSALFVYTETDGEITKIVAKFCNPEGQILKLSEVIHTTFSQWVLETFGNGYS